MTAPFIPCTVDGCASSAIVEVILYDVYRTDQGAVYDVFYEQDNTCQYLCRAHLSENEHHADTGESDAALRRYRGRVQYPHTNKRQALGFTTYRPLHGTSL